jgi:hypothetical protein
MYFGLVTDHRFSQVFRIAQLRLMRYSHPKANMQNHDQASWRQSVNEYDIPAASAVHASPHCQMTPKQLSSILTSPKITKSKRKAAPDSLTLSTEKKQKRVVDYQTTKQKQPASHKPPQNAHPFFIQPTSNLIRTNPLTNVERWRLRGWTWPEAEFKVGHQEDLVEVESPQGTKEGWGR